MRVRSEMDCDGDGNRSKSERVRENMKGDQALQRLGSKCVSKKKKTKALQQDQPKKINPMAVCIKRGLRPAQKKRGKMSKKHGLRPGLRPHV